MQINTEFAFLFDSSEGLKKQPFFLKQTLSDSLIPAIILIHCYVFKLRWKRLEAGGVE